MRKLQCPAPLRRARGLGNQRLPLLEVHDLAAARSSPASYLEMNLRVRSIPAGRHPATVDGDEYMFKNIHGRFLASGYDYNSKLTPAIVLTIRYTSNRIKSG